MPIFEKEICPGPFYDPEIEAIRNSMKPEDYAELLRYSSLLTILAAEDSLVICRGAPLFCADGILTIFRNAINNYMTFASFWRSIGRDVESAATRAVYHRR